MMRHCKSTCSGDTGYSGILGTLSVVFPVTRSTNRVTDRRAVERQSVASRARLLPFLGAPLLSFSTSSFVSAGHQPLFHFYDFITSLILVNRIRPLGTGFFHWKFIRSDCSPL